MKDSQIKSETQSKFLPWPSSEECQERNWRPDTSWNPNDRSPCGAMASLNFLYKLKSPLISIVYHHDCNYLAGITAPWFSW